MSQIVLCTAHARYPHSPLALYYLRANLGPLASQSKILEFELSRQPADIVEAIMRECPRVVAMSVYIWNATLLRQAARLLKTIYPDVCLILGGPEVSHELDAQPWTSVADYVVCGEGELVFRKLCEQLLSGASPNERVMQAPKPALAELSLPYPEYTDDDIRQRVIYVETSRGCPFECEFCLSSLDPQLRTFPLERIFDQLETLISRGARRFKFVDRTFNATPQRAGQILQFFLERHMPDLFLHFEIVPDRISDSLRDLLVKFPRESIQFEAGIQTVNPRVSESIGRRQNYEEIAKQLAWLRNNTGAHIHADLVAGLPGEDLESFGRGFDWLYRLQPQEIQVGILKRLRGTTIGQHPGMRFSPEPPYEVLQSDVLSFGHMQRLKRFARYWDLIANSGRFGILLPLLTAEAPSMFELFLSLSDWLFKQFNRAHGISVENLAAALGRFGIDSRGIDDTSVNAALVQQQAQWRAVRGAGERQRRHSTIAEATADRL